MMRELPKRLLARVSQCDGLDAIGVCIYPRSPAAASMFGLTPEMETDARIPRTEPLSEADEAEGVRREAPKPPTVVDIKLLSFGEFEKDIEAVRDDILDLGLPEQVEEAYFCELSFEDGSSDARLLVYPIFDGEDEIALIYVVAYGDDEQKKIDAIMVADSAIAELLREE